MCGGLDSSHKDRIRRLNKFRNFVTGEGGGGTPEFYDDDIPLLLLGSAAPAALLGEHADLFDDVAGSGNQIYGLLQACGTPSVEHDHMLKRSARHAMNLLKFLVCDFVEENSSGGGGGSSGSLNLFAQGFCSFPVDKYRFMSLDLHLIGDQRGGAKEDACHVMVLLLTKHMMEDGETPSPLSKDDLVASQQAQKAFDVWCSQHATKAQQDLMKKNAQKRKDSLAKMDRYDEGVGMGGTNATLEADDDDSADSDEDDDVGGFDDDGALAGLKRRKKAAKKELLEAQQAGDLDEVSGPALRWEDSQLYREQRARFAAHQRMQEGGEYHDTVRDSQEAAAEMAEREEEKSKILRKDPLGLKGTDFDLRTLETDQVDFLEQALLELQEELRKAEAGGEDDQALRAKKESLEMILDGIVGVAGVEANLAQSGRSILPTNPNFDPILFLTLVHRRATYEELVGSMNRLSSEYADILQNFQTLYDIMSCVPSSHPLLLLHCLCYLLCQPIRKIRSNNSRTWCERTLLCSCVALMV